MNASATASISVTVSISRPLDFIGAQIDKARRDQEKGLPPMNVVEGSPLHDRVKVTPGAVLVDGAWLVDTISRLKPEYGAQLHAYLRMVAAMFGMPRAYAAAFQILKRAEEDGTLAERLKEAEA